MGTHSCSFFSASIGGDGERTMRTVRVNEWSWRVANMEGVGMQL